MEVSDYKTNFHTHTYRCGHAIGKDEDYVKAAIENGFKILGFADHIFYEGYRGHKSDVDEYVDSILALKEKYKDQIEIHVGFEAEYNKEFDQYYKELLDNKKVEYLILGQHCYVEGDHHVGYFDSKHKNKAYKKYTHDLVKGIKTGYYNYVCHPDVINLYGIASKSYQLHCYKRIIKASKKANIPLEINLNGLRRKDNKYPHDLFFKLVAKYNAKVILGGDYHNFKDMYTTKDKEDAVALVNKYNLEVVDNIF